jgi:DNA-binding MarR family transcriptional regulator
MSTASAPEYKFYEQVGYLLRRAYQRHAAIFKEMVAHTQLTAGQFVVLCTVRDHDSCEVPDIVAATAIDEPSVRGIIERLKWRELLNVTHEPGDARNMLIRLTPAGRTIVETVTPIAEQITELTFADLDADERRTLVALLRRVGEVGDTGRIG